MKNFIVQLVSVILFIFIMAIPLMSCWNGVIPQLFGTIELKYGQAVDILIIIYIVMATRNLKNFPKE